MSKGKLFLLFIALSMILIITVYNSNYLNNSKDHAKEIKEPFGDTVVDLVDYKVYDFIDVPFRFILADIKITNIRPIHFELSRFQTDEGLQLDSIDDYRQEISRKGYDLVIQNVTTQLNSNEIELNAKILIPIKNIYRQHLIVNISGIKTDKLEFNLNKNKGSEEDFGLKVKIDSEKIENPASNEEVNSDTIDNGISEPNISNTMQVLSANLISKDLILYKGLEGYHRVDFANRVRILLVSVTMDYETEVQLSAARLVFSDNNQLYFALGPEYVVENGSNILNKRISQGTGSLIFQIDDKEFDVLNQPYSVEVRFKDTKEWVTIQMNPNE